MTSYTLVAGAVLSDEEGRVVLVEEQRPRLRGQWNLPTGRVEEAEHPKEAAAREVEEETGLAVALDNPIGVYVKPSDSDGVVCVIMYWATVSGSTELNPQDDDIGEARWVHPEAIEEYTLRSSHISQAVEDGFNGERIDGARIKHFDSS